ncbi:MAG: GNAT family N-acetyltransferase [Nocardioides sp.]
MTPLAQQTPVSIHRLRLRPAVAADVVFLRALTRESLVEQHPEASGAYIDLQVRAREFDFDERWPTAVWEVIEECGEPIGRMLVERKRGAIHLIEVVLRRGRRGVGIGSEVLATMIAQSDSEGHDLVLVVDEGSKALRFHQQLGFDEVQTSCGAMLIRRRSRRLRER